MDKRQELRSAQSVRAAAAAATIGDFESVSLDESKFLTKSSSKNGSVNFIVIIITIIIISINIIIVTIIIIFAFPTTYCFSDVRLLF